MNHTPGPWRVTHHGFQIVKVENKDRVIFDGFHGEEANAALAAAAPDLLEGVDWLLPFARAGLSYSPGHKNIQKWNNLVELVEKLKQ